MSFTVRVRRAAELDIAQAQGWYDAQRKGLGAEFHGEVSEVFARLTETPFIYATTYRDVRKAVVHRFPYLVWYCVVGTVVTVLACTDGRQDPDRALSRFQ